MKYNTIALQLTLALAGFSVWSQAPAQSAAQADLLKRSKSVIQAAENAPTIRLPEQGLPPELREQTRRLLSQPTPPAGQLPSVDTNASRAPRSDTFDLEQLAKRYAPPKLDQQTGPLVFVSLSMPEASLMKLAQDGRKVGATLILRGTVKGSLRATVEALHAYGQQGVDLVIDPNAFKRYGVRVVPSFVVDLDPEKPTCGEGTACRSNVSPLIEGDVSIDHALQRIATLTSGRLQQEAQAWAKTLRGARP